MGSTQTATVGFMQLLNRGGVGFNRRSYPELVNIFLFFLHVDRGGVPFERDPTGGSDRQELSLLEAIDSEC